MIDRAGVWLAAVALVLFVVAMMSPAPAQLLEIGTDNKDVPLEVYADEGIEWEQELKIFTARGNARAVRGDVEVNADVLKAYYREKPEGGTEIWRLDAEGHVVITSTGEKAYGDKAVYDVDNAILVLNGKGVRFVTDQDVITADRQIEYWEGKQMAVARGNAYAVREEKKLRADVISAHFRKNESGQTKVYRVDAYDNVYIVMDQDVVTADRGVYNVESGIATLTGSVKMSREGNQLNGCSAVVNLNTGVSKMKSCVEGGAGGRVQGLILPRGGNKK